MATGPLTPDELAQLDQIKALEGNVHDQVNLIFQEAAPDAARAIVQLSKFGSDERIKMQASVHILDRTIGMVKDKPTKLVDNPYKDMMAEVTQLLETAAAQQVADAPSAVGFSEEFDFDLVCESEPTEVSTYYNDIIHKGEAS